VLCCVVLELCCVSENDDEQKCLSLPIVLYLALDGFVVCGQPKTEIKKSADPFLNDPV
jgi:hypothetical protein